MRSSDLRDKFIPEPNSGCWLWALALNANGYGIVRYAGRTSLAHRAVYEAFAGPIPSGLQLDHLCRVRCCVNPRHLEPVTGNINIARGSNATRTRCIRGHEYDDANTYFDGRHRTCRTCRRAMDNRRYPQRKAARLNG